jgi:hypothetical protein
MIAGHFGAAAMAKARVPRAPLWILMFATVWLDIVFVPLFLMGIESITPVGASPPGYGDAIIHADYTHSLVGAILLSLLLGGLSSWFWNRAIGIWVGAISFSHWILDLIVHRADMPILPGDLFHLPRFGLGLWKLPLLSSAAELVLVALGALLYLQAATKAADENGQQKGPAQLTAASILIFGVLVWALDFSGILN